MNTVTVSKMSGKLSGLQGINSNPLDNAFCERMSKTESICKYCYSRKMVKTYRKTASACWTKNGKVLSEHILNDAEIPKLKTDMIRFHSHGELINIIHYANFKKIAFAYPDKHFALWTKRKDIVLNKLNGLKPDNMMLVYSNPCIDKPMLEPPKGFDKVFNVLTTKYTLDNDILINCGSKSCLTCGLCYKSNVKVINELLK